MDDSFNSGERFLTAEARLVERRMFAACLKGASPTGVVDALRGYQNEDGGFGYGLEPDTLCPTSLPIYAEIALQYLAAVGARDQEMLRKVADYLGRTADQVDANGAVPPAFPVIAQYPHAEHWSEWTYAPGLNPTAGLVGLLYELDYSHPWRDAATGYCWDALDNNPLPDEVHSLSEVLGFLAHVPERDRAEKLAAEVVDHLATVPMFHLDPNTPGYGLTPLHIAPHPDSRWRSLFSDAQIEGHLDHLVAEQLPDGSWPVAWEPPAASSLLAWRGMVTLTALRTLTAYGRLSN
ncbi:MAG TPA: hypothetical protein VGX23_27465 [Actinocrinis sp.]|nr:hypothetical protein [Actinocrinis sp.]